MKILGIDPGMAIVGYSILDFDGKNLSLSNSGSIRTEKGQSESARLLEIFNDMTSIVKEYQPDICAIEKLFFVHNQTTVMPVAHARGVILTVLEQFKIPIYEYTPMEVKKILTGYGRADKKEVEQMVKFALATDKLPKLDDTIDSIAIAISYTRSPNVIDDLKKFEISH
ncbi:MAG: crossover junction endodeoxyribonuclease RuvC [Candidatus Gastranaerophilaceae bacterium]